MAPRKKIRIPCSCTIRTTLLVVGLLGIAPVASANSVESADVRVPQTHRVFVDSCLRELARHLLAGFTPNRTSPLVIVPDTLGDSVGTVAAGIARDLSARGLLIRDDTTALSDVENWTLYYTLAPVELTLSEPQRRKFLGKIWVKRTFDAGMSISVNDDALGENVWTGAADSTYFDWILKSALKKLQSPELSPKSPTTGLEKAKLPFIAGAGAVIIGVIMLSLN